MKKTLIAVAALAALSTTGAMAADVKITGTYDATHSSITVNTGAAGGKDTTDNYRTLDGLGTTGVKFAITEDLGDGLTAQGMYEHNFAGGLNAGTANASANGSGEWYAGIEGGFGRVRVGAPNTVTLGVQTLGSASFGTKPGGRTGYLDTNGLATPGGALNLYGTSVTRFYGAIQYQSPVISGAVINATYVPGANTEGDATRGTILDAGALWTDGKGITAGASYFSSGEVVDPATGDTTTGALSLITVGAKVGLKDLAGVPLTVGAIYYTQTQEVADTAAAGSDDATNSGFQVGVDFALSDALTLSGTFQSATINSGAPAADDAAASQFAVGAQYKLGKNATAYARYISATATDAAAEDVTASGYLLGLMVTF